MLWDMGKKWGVKSLTVNSTALVGYFASLDFNLCIYFCFVPKWCHKQILVDLVSTVSLSDWVSDWLTGADLKLFTVYLDYISYICQHPEFLGAPACLKNHKVLKEQGTCQRLEKFPAVSTAVDREIIKSPWSRVLFSIVAYVHKGQGTREFSNWRQIEELDGAVPNPCVSTARCVQPSRSSGAWTFFVSQREVARRSRSW